MKPLSRITQCTRDSWALLVILMVQATVTLWVMLASNGPSNDEALYLGVGHLELEHLLHGGPAPAVSGYFSGAPVLYPPLGAVAYNLGGLEGARCLSLGFMLAATVLLWSVTVRLCTKQAAICSSVMFALLAPVLHLGSLATYDAMSLFFVALAGWCAARTGWRALAGAAAALVAANAVKYASALFDPVVVGVAAATMWNTYGVTKRSLLRSGILVLGVAAAICGLLLIAGPGYWRGVRATTVTRRAGTDPVPVVLAHAAAWGWVILVLAIAGVVVSVAKRQPRTQTVLFGIMAAAGFLAPAEQARIHTLLSLDKHLAFGAWFAAVPAGYAAGQAITALKTRGPALTGWIAGFIVVTARSVAVLAIPLAALGWTQAQAMASYSQTDYLIPVLQPLTAHGGRFLSDTARVDAYSLPRVPWNEWVKVQVTEAQTRTQQLAHQILHRRFTIIALGLTKGDTPQAQLRAVLKQDAYYKLVSKVPSSGPGHRVFLVWELRTEAK